MASLGLKKTLLVFGGSQGASFLNEIASFVVQKLSWKAIHLTGPKDEEKVKDAYIKLGVEAQVKAFEKNMHSAYMAADVVLCRSGASTIAELIHYELPAVLIPYPHAGHHQRKNGDFLAKHTPGIKVILQGQATVERIVEEIEAVKLMKMNASHLKKDPRSDIIDVIRGMLT